MANTNPYNLMFGIEPPQTISRAAQLADLAACLGSENGLASIFKEAGINLSMFGIGLVVKGSVPISNIQVALSRMLDSILTNMYMRKYGLNCH